MSTDQQGYAIPWTVNSAAAAIAVNRLVYDDGSNTAVLSVTDQATTNTLKPIGVFYGTKLGAAAVAADTGLDVRRGDAIWVPAGTGGVSAGERFCSEYNGTAASAGRAFGVDTSNTPFHPGQVDCGEVLQGASAGDLALVCFDPQVYSSQYIGSAVELATAGAGTITAALCMSVQVARDCAGGSRTDTTATGTQIYTEALKYGYGIGDSWTLTYTNTSDAAEAITLAAGSGVTLTNTGADLVISQSESARLQFAITAVNAVSLVVIKD